MWKADYEWVERVNWIGFERAATKYHSDIFKQDIGGKKVKIKIYVEEGE